MTAFSRASKLAFATPPLWQVTIPVSGHGDQHVGILNNFADAILDGAPLIAPAREGVHSVELANAMLYSTFTGQTIELPLDGAAYERQLSNLIDSKARP
jgi:predicted dehydrogenase